MKNSCSHNNRQDYGNEPLVINIDKVTKENIFYRRALWTGKNLQVTVMSIPPQGEIGLEMHSNVDQFIRVESGCGLVKMGSCQHKLDEKFKVNSDFAIIVPSGTWHNVINTGMSPLKLYSIYAPPQHPYGTVHETRAVAEAEGD